MFSKTSTLFALFAVAAQIVSAGTPPACLLAAVNTSKDPSDLKTVCGADGAKVQDAIKMACGGSTDAAMMAFTAVCKSAGQTPSSVSSGSTTSTPTPSGKSSKGLHTLTYTTTAYDTECSCTKTKVTTTCFSAVPTGMSSAYAYATGTGSMATGTAAAVPYPTNGAAAAPYSNSTAPVPTTTASSTLPKSTGAAGRVSAQSFAGLALAAAGLAIFL